jgi:hypothetical protein
MIRLVSDAVSRIAASTRCGMFHSVELAKAIHNDRIREIERIARERRLLQDLNEAEMAATGATDPVRSLRVPAPVARGGGSACEPA